MTLGTHVHAEHLPNRERACGSDRIKEKRRKSGKEEKSSGSYCA